ncbi:MAG: succinylglutamate desuccinylase/aspartoacylase family protein [Atopobiaceae bacterium]|nr:succinylglutamate desuccinylase/aspartoacylase family protein [Atopobiaceae bacterium]
MKQTVFTAMLPIGESLVVQKNHICGTRRNGPRIAVVAGMYGDELEGQFVTFELARRLNECPGDLRGVVDIYPALNPLGLSSHEHGVPQFDIDLERTFPGSPDGSLTEVLADAVFNDILGAHACVVLHSSDARVRELTQVRIDEQDDAGLISLASLLNPQIIWARSAQSVSRPTLAHALNARGCPTVVVEMGSGAHINKNSGVWLVEGILRLLEKLHAWTGSTIALPYPRVVRGGNVAVLMGSDPGLFLPSVEHGDWVRRGDVVGEIVDPLEGMTRSELRAPCNGLVFSLRDYPFVQPGSLLARILEEER